MNLDIYTFDELEKLHDEYEGNEEMQNKISSYVKRKFSIAELTWWK